MTDGVIATDRKGKVILINDPAINFLNITREHTLNRPIASVLGIEEQYSFEDLIHMKEPLNLDFSTEEKPFILRANFSVIQKETGFVNGLITVLHDITEEEKIDMERRNSLLTYPMSCEHLYYNEELFRSPCRWGMER